MECPNETDFNDYSFDRSFVSLSKLSSIYRALLKTDWISTLTDSKHVSGFFRTFFLNFTEGDRCLSSKRRHQIMCA